MKTTKTKIIAAELIALSIFCASVSSAQTRTLNLPNLKAAPSEGTGVGNGDPGDRQATIARIKAELMRNPGAAGIGNEYEQMVQWCNQVSSILGRELRRAHNQMEFGQFIQSEYTMIDALIAARESAIHVPSFSGPMTRALIDRTLVYVDTIGNDNNLSQMTRISFLEGSIKFIVHTSSGFDPGFYLPHHYGQGNRGGEFDINSFERELINIAAYQLQFIANTFTETCGGNSYYQNCPVGTPSAFLKVAEFATRFIASDLRSNLHVAVQACNIQRLESLSSELNQFNQSPTQSSFQNSAQAIDFTANEMRSVALHIRNLNSPCGLDFED